MKKKFTFTGFVLLVLSLLVPTVLASSVHLKGGKMPYHPLQITA